MGTCASASQTDSAATSPASEKRCLIHPLSNLSSPTKLQDIPDSPDSFTYQSRRSVLVPSSYFIRGYRGGNSSRNNQVETSVKLSNDCEALLSKDKETGELSVRHSIGSISSYNSCYSDVTNPRNSQFLLDERIALRQQLFCLDTEELDRELSVLNSKFQCQDNKAHSDSTDTLSSQENLTDTMPGKGKKGGKGENKPQPNKSNQPKNAPTPKQAAPPKKNAPNAKSPPPKTMSEVEKAALVPAAEPVSVTPVAPEPVAPEPVAPEPTPIEEKEPIEEEVDALVKSLVVNQPPVLENGLDLDSDLVDVSPPVQVAGPPPVSVPAEFADPVPVPAAAAVSESVPVSDSTQVEEESVIYEATSQTESALASVEEPLTNGVADESEIESLDPRVMELMEIGKTLAEEGARLKLQLLEMKNDELDRENGEGRQSRNKAKTEKERIQHEKKLNEKRAATAQKAVDETRELKEMLAQLEQRTIDMSNQNMARESPSETENMTDIIDENLKLIEASSEDSDEALMEEYNMVSMDDVEDAIGEDVAVQKHIVTEETRILAAALERSTQIKLELKEHKLKMAARQEEAQSVSDRVEATLKNNRKTRKEINAQKAAGPQSLQESIALETKKTVVQPVESPVETKVKDQVETEVEPQEMDGHTYPKFLCKCKECIQKFFPPCDYVNAQNIESVFTTYSEDKANKQKELEAKTSVYDQKTMMYDVFSRTRTTADGELELEEELGMTNAVEEEITTEQATAVNAGPSFSVQHFPEPKSILKSEKVEERQHKVSFADIVKGGPKKNEDEDKAEIQIEKKVEIVTEEPGKATIDKYLYLHIKDTPKECVKNTKQVNTPKVNTPKVNTPKQNTPKQNTPKQNTPKQNTPKQNTTNNKKAAGNEVKNIKENKIQETKLKEHQIQRDNETQKLLDEISKTLETHTQSLTERETGSSTSAEAAQKSEEKSEESVDTAVTETSPVRDISGTSSGRSWSDTFSREKHVPVSTTKASMSVVYGRAMKLQGEMARMQVMMSQLQTQMRQTNGAMEEMLSIIFTEMDEEASELS